MKLNIPGISYKLANTERYNTENDEWENNNNKDIIIKSVKF